jgi:hypothetical protein
MTTTAYDPFAAQKDLVDQLDKSGWNLIVGDAFVRGMRDIGYKSTSYAMAELIDNSVQANATWLDVTLGFNKNSAKPARMAVIDNGWGMVPAMHPGKEVDRDTSAGRTPRSGDPLHHQLCRVDHWRIGLRVLPRRRGNPHCQA